LFDKQIGPNTSSIFVMNASRGTQHQLTHGYADGMPQMQLFAR
jgi:hypothetical protein